MNAIKNIIVHCSDSTWGCVREVRQWHIDRGWKDIGYHFVILNGNPTGKFYLPALDGSIECGRCLDENLLLEGNEIGAHTLGYNSSSIGICYIGKHPTPAQFWTLEKLIGNLMHYFGIEVADVLGHCETASGIEQGKTCPNINMGLFRETLKKNGGFKDGR